MSWVVLPNMCALQDEITRFKEWAPPAENQHGECEYEHWDHLLAVAISTIDRYASIEVPTSVADALLYGRKKGTFYFTAKVECPLFYFFSDSGASDRILEVTDESFSLNGPPALTCDTLRRMTKTHRRLLKMPDVFMATLT